MGMETTELKAPVVLAALLDIGSQGLDRPEEAEQDIGFPEEPALLDIGSQALDKPEEAEQDIGLVEELALLDIEFHILAPAAEHTGAQAVQTYSTLTSVQIFLPTIQVLHTEKIFPQ
jgi:hypothetical protein